MAWLGCEVLITLCRCLATWNPQQACKHAALAAGDLQALTGGPGAAGGTSLSGRTTGEAPSPREPPNALLPVQLLQVKNTGNAFIVSKPSPQQHLLPPAIQEVIR